jgi:hypothetical protein
MTAPSKEMPDDLRAFSLPVSKRVKEGEDGMKGEEVSE